jgi:putative transcriptional regulator
MATGAVTFAPVTTAPLFYASLSLDLQNKLCKLCKVHLTFFAKYTMLKGADRSGRNDCGGGRLKTKIRELRRLLKLSQEELAQAVGTTRQTITSIEVEKFTASLVLAYKIAKYFGMTIEEVFDFSDVEDL